MSTLRTQQGFTLVEAIVVMVVTGILAGIMVLFIRQPVQNYADAAARGDLTDTADLALRRMARELRTALPNSVRVTSAGGVWFVQFIPTKAGGQYLAVEDNASRAGAAPLSFTDSAARVFNVVGPVPVGAYAIVPGDYIAIYNLGNGIAGADAYSGSNVALVTNVAQNNGAWQVFFQKIGDPSTNPFAESAIANGVPNSSPDHRFNVIGLPVTFRCEGKADGTGTLARMPDSGFSSVQSQPALTATPPLLAANVLGCDFSLTQAANLQNGMIGMTLSLARARAGAAANGLETVTLVHQIHVDNTP